jgi:hypothetical protein
MALQKNLGRKIEAARQAKSDVQAPAIVEPVQEPEPASDRAPEEDGARPAPTFGTF